MKKVLCGIGVLLMVMLFFPASRVWADTGPKPSVHLNVEGIAGEPYYITLLSKTETSGPWNVEGEFKGWRSPKEIWEKFRDYKDKDGFYFVGYFEECSKTNTFTWGYYPPDEFKILIYLPEKDRMICSEQSNRRTEFHTYYNVTLDGDTIIRSEQIVHTYNTAHEVGSLLFRVIFTILIEVGIGWYCGYRKKKQVVGILLTNVVTQGILNLLLNLIMLQRGEVAFKLYYFVLECFVFIIEGLVYRILLAERKETNIDRSGIWWYTFIANVASFIGGVLLSMAIPSMFT